MSVEDRQDFRAPLPAGPSASPHLNSTRAIDGDTLALEEVADEALARAVAPAGARRRWYRYGPGLR